MPIFKIKGQVVDITQPHTYNKKGDAKITVDVNIPSFITEKRMECIPFDFMGDNMKLTSVISIGDYVEIDFELRGRKWINPETKDAVRHYNNEASDIKVIDND